MAATGAFEMVCPSRDERVSPGNDSEEKSWTNFVVVNLFFVCEQYVTRIQKTLDKNPPNCNDS